MLFIYFDRASIYYSMDNCEAALNDVNKLINGDFKGTVYSKDGISGMLKLRSHIYADLRLYEDSIGDANDLLR